MGLIIAFSVWYCVKGVRMHIPYCNPEKVVYDPNFDAHSVKNSVVQ